MSASPLPIRRLPINLKKKLKHAREASVPSCMITSFDLQLRDSTQVCVEDTTAALLLLSGKKGRHASIIGPNFDPTQQRPDNQMLLKDYTVCLVCMTKTKLQIILGILNQSMAAR